MEALERLRASAYATPEIRWRLTTALAALGLVTQTEILNYRDRTDPSGRGRVLAERSIAALPERRSETLERAWQDADVTNETLDELLSVVALPGAARRTGARYIAEMERAWKARPLHMGRRLARGLFPADVDLSGGDADHHEDVKAVTTWAASVELPEALGRIVRESVCSAQRRLARQADSAAFLGARERNVNVIEQL